MLLRMPSIFSSSWGLGWWLVQSSASTILLSLLFLLSTEVVTASIGTVVFDMDGTITFNDVGCCGVRDGANEAMSMWMDKGYQVVLLTARPTIFETYTKDFLRCNGFPVDDVSEWFFAPRCFIDQQGSQDFKSQTLADLIAQDHVISYAYGDSTTDFAAYENGGAVQQDKVFALRRGDECRVGNFGTCLDDFRAHLEYIQNQPDAP